jgi:hypothetical protein
MVRRVSDVGGARPVEVGVEGGALSASLATRIQSSGRGRPLEPGVREPFERAFGADFSAVRVHPDSAVAPRIMASAFTVGHDIHFAAGRYRPSTDAGRSVLAHELAHVVQQTGAGSPGEAGTRIRRRVGFEYEIGEFSTERWGLTTGWAPHPKGAKLAQLPGYQVTADEATGGGSRLEFIVKEIDETQPNAVQTLTNQTLPAVTAMLTHLSQVAGGARGGWVTGDQFPQLRGSSWDRIKAIQPAPNDARDISGQLQLTAGVSMNKLADVVSGQQTTAYAATDQARFDEVMNRYQPVVGGVWSFAVAQVGATAPMNLLTAQEQRQLSALVALMASVPINVRTSNNIEYPKATAGGLLARSDFARIANALSVAVKGVLTPANFEGLVIGTINRVPTLGGVAAHDDIFPTGVGFIPTVPDMSGLTIGAWARDVVPTAGAVWGWWKGSDQLTKANFPGTAQQRQHVESMGGFGSKVDPGDKPIFEFRSLGIVFGDELATVIADLIGYLNQP